MSVEKLHVTEYRHDAGAHAAAHQKWAMAAALDRARAAMEEAAREEAA